MSDKKQAAYENGNEAAAPFGFDRDVMMECFGFGSTKRELFAAMAMQGLLAARETRMQIRSHKEIATYAVEAADALLLALEETRDE